MMSNQIRFIIDIDGFQLKGESYMYIKECAVYDTLDEILYLYHVQLPNSILYRGRFAENIAYTTRKVHGMYFQNYPDDIEFDDFLRQIWDLAINSNDCWGYKGGTVEKMLLNSIGIRNHINIENFNCPKFATLIEKLIKENKPVPKVECNRHIGYKGKSSHMCHCSGVEVLVFANYLKENQP